MQFCVAFPVKYLLCMTSYCADGKLVSQTLKIICFLLLLNIQAQPCHGETGNTTPINFHFLYGRKDAIYSQIGDINIGDIADIYEYGEKRYCDNSLHPFSAVPENTESTKFAVDWVNQNPNLLPNVTLGFVIRGTCELLSVNLGMSLFFLPRTERLCEENSTVCQTRQMLSSDNQYMTHDVIGMLAPSLSTNAVVLSSFMTTARLPMVGYSAGSYELRYTKFHPYFFRVNTNDLYQIRGLMKFVSDIGWTYVQYVYRDDIYGRDARKYMTNNARRYGVCIAAAHLLGVSNYLQVATALLEKPLARAVVVFVSARRFSLILQEIHHLNATGHFIWIGSTQMKSYAASVFTYTGMTTDPGIGAFLIHPLTKFVDKYYEHVNAIDVFKTKNPWLKPVWEQLMNCSYANDSCPKDQNISQTLHYTPDKSASLRMDAVLAIAHAVHNLLQDYCPSARGKEARACIDGTVLREYVKKVKFEGFNGPVEFNRRHALKGKFTISQILNGKSKNWFTTKDKNRLYDEEVAIYDSQSDNFTYLTQSISWSHMNIVERLVPVNDSLIPESVCSRPCIVGEYKIEKDLPCCWDCLRCRDNERLIQQNTGCESCPLFQWPDPMSDFTTCVDIPLTYQTVKDPVPIALVSIAVIVLILTLFVYSAYVKYRNERVIKASSKELSFIQLVGISGGYITVILFQTTPTDIMCQCIFFLFSMSFAMLYSPLLVKTVRIFRIFRSASENKKPRFVSPQSQLIISVLLIAIQFLLCGVVYFLYVPGSRRTQPIWSEKMVELSCDFTIPGLSSFLGYNILLVSLCSVFAFMVRKLPDNYNESRFISMCVSTTLLIWMAFIPTYFTADREYMRMFLLCMALLLNHSVALILCFFPRIYAAAFMRDESLNFAIKK